MTTNYYNNFILELKNKGFRLTKLRKTIIEELDLKRKPLSVQEIIELLKGYGLVPHKTSVYRELSFMIKEGIVNKITFCEKQERFELATEHHHHVVCESCGEIENIDCNEGIRQIEHQLKSQKFKVNNHLIEFFGLCRKCQT